MRAVRLLLLVLAGMAGPLRADLQYVGSTACAPCHKSIYDRYLRTGMGRSVTRASAQLPQVPAIVRDDRLKREFQVFRRNGETFQSAAEAEFERTWKLEYVIGSGANGMSFAIRRGDYLFQAPLSYYSNAGKWELSPGFEATGEISGRPLHEACLACHAGRARAVPGRDGLYSDPPFAEMAVGCENCHGPGELHMQGGGKRPSAAIVNPARLSPRLSDDICMRCHQGGAARVLLPGRNYSDFRPGEPLLRTVAIFGLPVAQTDPDLLEHHQSMKSSLCYRASGEKLRCITCHDPHEQPAAEAAPAYFRAKCMTCHDTQPCSLSPVLRRQTKPADNCIGCHMVKRSVQKIAHSALTDHRILRRPGTNGSAREASTPVAGLPGLLLLNNDSGGRSLPLVTRLAAYGELMNREPALQATYLELLQQAEREIPENPLVLSALGRKALLERSPKAAEYLTRAEENGDLTVASYLDLSRALAEAGRPGESLASLERAYARYPYSKELRKHLILAYIQRKDYAKAQSALEGYVLDFPEDGFMRQLLGQAKQVTK